MKIFIDTADVNEIREAVDMGMIDGVTTNPSLIAKTGRKPEEVIKEICELVDGPISAEAVSLDAEGMMKEARSWAAIPPEHHGEVPDDGRGPQGDPGLSGRGDQDQRDAGVLPLSRSARGQGGGHLRQPLRWSPR